MTDALAALQEREVRLHFVGASIAAFTLAFTGFEKDFVEFEGVIARGADKPFGGRIGEALRRVAGAGLVEHDAERVNVRRRRARTFGRDVAFRADERPAFAIRGYQSNVSEFGPAMHEDDVARLDIAVDEMLPVEQSESTNHVERETEAVGRGQAAQTFEVGAERARNIGFKFSVWSFALVRITRTRRPGLCPRNGIGQFHHVIKVAFRIVASNMEHMDQSAGTARHRLVALNTRKLALVGAVTFKLSPLNDLHRSQGAHDVARQPHFAIRTTPDGPQQLVVGDDGLVHRSQEFQR